MSLHVYSVGTGPDIVLLHGWGLHAEVWHDVVQQLATRYRVTLIDLPGHGRSGSVEDYSLSQVAACIAEVAPPHAIWLGWSLGGMIAMHIAMTPAMSDKRVRALILVASTPQFVCDEDWPHAMTRPVLESFARSLQENHAQTVQHFLTLQTRGSMQGQHTLRRLRQAVTQHPPQFGALQGGLAILRDARLRPYLQQITCPVQIILGERDMLVPHDMGRALQAQLPNARLDVIAAAGHAPFLSHPAEFLDCVNEFLTSNSNSEFHDEQ